jgi:hypothetical protein
LLANTDAPELARVNVTLSFTGGSVGPSGERWDYFAAPSQAPVPPPDAGVDGSVDAGTTECRVLNGANGTVTGPTPFSFPDTAAPFVVEVPPYGVSLLVFEATE